MKTPGRIFTLMILCFVFILACEPSEDTVVDDSFTPLSEKAEEEESESDSVKEKKEVVVLVSDGTTNFFVQNCEKSGLENCEEVRQYETAYFALRRPRPKVCPVLVGSQCAPENPFLLAVPAISAEVWAEAYFKGRLVASTEPEMGGSVGFDEKLQVATLHFGVSTDELVQEGVTIVGATLVNLEGEIYEVLFKDTFFE